MAGEQNVWRLSMPVFHGFRDDRPKEEKWELIDGRPVMMAPPTLVHQRICKNITRLLDDKLVETRPEWEADGEIGLLLRADQKYNPEPDVTVIDADIALGERYVDRFYSVTEVLSPNDEEWVLDAKIGYYTAHEHCTSVMFVEQTAIGCRLWRRIGGVWQDAHLTDPAARLDLPEIGDIGALAACYRRTPLWPTAIT
ncbi:MAG: Uma2 family endonuclease [Rhodospirillales bacterium]|nr:Uma2 family endonuclease [Rhodospirillales bacterium]